MYVRIDYPSIAAEKKILQLAREQARSGHTAWQTVLHLVTQAQLFTARQEIMAIHLAPALEEYLVQLVVATRTPKRYGDDLANWITYGASPRATIALERCARAHAWLNGKEFVAPHDIHAIAADVLRHRIILSYEAEAEGITTDRIISDLISRVAVP